MKTSILYTKLQRPSVAPDIVSRSRLIDLLEEGRHRPLTLISAPAGYGKSTLASLWADACDLLYGWVSLDESDNDLYQFLEYILAAVRSMFPDVVLRSEVLLEAAHLPPSADLAHMLLNDLHQAPEPFVLVLDDYHRIEESPVHDLMAALLAHPAEAMHLVLVTRHDPPLPIASMRGLGQVTEIRENDLSFTPAEAAAFLSRVLSVPVDDAAAELLDRKIEGWATGLRLAGLYLQDSKDLEKLVRQLSGSSQHIAEYLVAEVLSKQNPEMLTCLLKTSILDRFCAPLHLAMHRDGPDEWHGRQESDADPFIEWLVKTNLFVIPLDDRGYWFRYHHLFQAFLQDMLRKQYGADRIAELHRDARRWFAENGLIEEAIRHALLAGDTEAAVRLVVDHRYDLMNTSQFFRLNRWLRLLPEDAVAETPLLITTRAFMGMVYGPRSDAYTFMERARRLASVLPPEHPDMPTLNGEVASMQSALDCLVGQPDSTLVNAEEAIQLLPKEALFARSVAVASMAGSYQMKGDGPQGVELMRHSLASTEWPASIRIRMWFYLCILTFMDANASELLIAARECLKLTGATRFAHPRCNTLCYLGAVHYLRNQLPEARRCLTDIIGNREGAQPSYVVQAGGILAFLYLAEGYPEEAGRIVKVIGMDSVLMQDDYAQALRDTLSVELALRQGQVDEARRLSVGVDFDQFPPHWYFYVPQLTRIKLLMAEGTDQNLKEARIQLADLEEKMRSINRKNVRINVLALLALVCHKLGDKAAALEHLEAALALAEPGGWVRNFVDLGDPITDLLERLNQVHPGHTFTQQILNACRAGAVGIPSSDRDDEETISASGQTPVSVLTHREINLLPLLAEGLSNKEIAARLFISPVTVKTHLQNIYRKLNAKGRIDALKKARELDIIIDD